MENLEAALPYATGAVALSVAGSYIYLRSFSPYVYRDLRFAIKAIRTQRRLKAMAQSHSTIADHFQNTVDKNPNSPALVFIDKTTRSYTWLQFDKETNKVANWALSVGIKKGDTVALMVNNRPEFLFYLFGLLKVGAVISLINTALLGAPLRYSLEVCKAESFFIGVEHTAAVNEIRDAEFDKNRKWFSISGDVPNFTSLDRIVDQHSTIRPPRSVRKGLTMNSPAVYIYTSGTTGNPKPSIIKHIRFVAAGTVFSNLVETTKADKIYSPLPLYHSSALFIGFGQCLVTGSTFVFRQKFSASSYISDSQANGCTLALYIGELCRYLLNSPPLPTDKTHKLRAVIGNGLRAEIWKDFTERFKIPLVFEFYASTEGNASLFNSLGKEKAVGWIPPILKNLSPLKLVKFDVQNEVPIRTKDGFCVPCKPNEVGELLGLIEQGDPAREFVGYTDSKATENKILRNVFVKGDAYFRSGDLLRYDEEGFWYFVDRIGDTFRWKGENVATSEVANVLSVVKGVKEANVYGVQIPNKDGRAGMASIVIDPDTFSWTELYEQLNKNLPKFAQPVFVRILKEMEITSTFKHRKVELVKEGFNPETLKDPIYFRDDGQGKYIPLDVPLYNKIINNQYARL